MFKLVIKSNPINVNLEGLEAVMVYRKWGCEPQNKISFTQYEFNMDFTLEQVESNKYLSRIFEKENEVYIYVTEEGIYNQIIDVKETILNEKINFVEDKYEKFCEITTEILNICKEGLEEVLNDSKLLSYDTYNVVENFMPFIDKKCRNSLSLATEEVLGYEDIQNVRKVHKILCNLTEIEEKVILYHVRHEFGGTEYTFRSEHLLDEGEFVYCNTCRGINFGRIQWCEIEFITPREYRKYKTCWSAENEAYDHDFFSKEEYQK